VGEFEVAISGGIWVAAGVWVNAAFHIPLMTDPFAPLSEEEFEELDHFLLFGVDTEEGMTIGMVDGFLHAIAVGPTTVHPKGNPPEMHRAEK
jgi:uncharacterized protein